MQFSYRAVAHIEFGIGQSSKLAYALASLGVKKPLLITDSCIVEIGLVAPILSQLKANSIACQIYSNVVADPPESNVLEAVELAKSAGCDSVIGFGGGSSMDVAKLVAALLEGQQSLDEMYGVDQIAGSRLPLVQIPTTAGTGSEVTSVAILTIGESTKQGVVSDVLFADYVLLDPELTLGLPAHVTAATGIDAMVHAIEAYTSKRLKNPISDMLALKALELMSTSIEEAVHDSSNLKARSDMLLGATLAGQAFANAPVGAVHALAYPLGGLYHIPHGLSNSLVLPHVLRFNASVASEHYDRLASVILNCPDCEQGADRLSQHFLSLAKSLGLQTTLSEMGISKADLPELAEQAMLQERLLINNPRIVSYAQALEIYHQAY